MISGPCPILYPQVNNSSIPQGHLPEGKNGASICAMDIEDVRRANLKKVLKAKFQTQRLMAEELKCAPNYFSRVLGGTKGIKDLIRQWERDLGYDVGALDREDFDVAQTKGHRQPISSFPAPEPQSAAPQQLPESAVTRPPPKHVWNIVAPNEKARTEKVVHIPVLDVQGSQGDGREVPDHEMVASQISVRESWLRRNLAFSAPGNLSIIAGVGDSMKPTFSDGDLLLVDRGVSEIRVDAVYVLELHNKLYIKRLQIRPDGAILMLSDNKAYEPYLIQEADMESVHVRARVLMAWNANKL